LLSQQVCCEDSSGGPHKRLRRHGGACDVACFTKKIAIFLRVATDTWPKIQNPYLTQYLAFAIALNEVESTVFMTVDLHESFKQLEHYIKRMKGFRVGIEFNGIY
jgi:hypothetical protein